MREFLIPALAFGTLFVMLWFGMASIRGVKKDKREGKTSALATRDDERETTMLTQSLVEDSDAGIRPLRGDAPLAGMALRVDQARRAH